ncbi:hypothetical protein SAMN03097699_0569 [Flavobacteriaceae bacterium MAR_2010_188]|nr:hypothetical protein SAMN03097699_0569 [Flavobacteriaceae bacterium MAR_2010_188]
MKKIIFSSILLILVVFPTTLNAQDSTDHSLYNYVVLTKKIQQLRPILLTAEALKKEDQHHFGDFQVIICGKEIEDLTNLDKMGEFVSMAKEAGVTLVACGFSLNKFKVDVTKIPEGILMVENGILHNFQLQKKGYYSLGL